MRRPRSRARSTCSTRTTISSWRCSTCRCRGRPVSPASSACALPTRSCRSWSSRATRSRRWCARRSPSASPVTCRSRPRRSASPRRSPKPWPATSTSPSCRARPPSKSRPSDEQRILQRLRDLTPQQLAVLELVREGRQNKVIAHELKLAETTVKAHVSEVLRKLGVSSRTQAVIEVARIDFELLKKGPR